MTARRARFAVVLGVTLVVVVTGCGRTPAAQSRAESAEEHVSRVGEIQDLHSPEAVLYDPEQDVYFVSNIFGYGSTKDNNGYIVRVNAGRLSDMRIVAAGGVAGVTLHAPKGMALVGNTVWVADIDVLRGFDRVSWREIVRVDLSGYGAVMLNDIAAAPDGVLYVTDSGIEMTEQGIVPTGGDKIFVIRSGHTPGLLTAGTELRQPNGIVWDTGNNRLIVASFASFGSEVYTLDPVSRTRSVLARGKGRFDGLAMLTNGAVLATSWHDSTLRLIGNEGERQLLHGLAQPAAIGVDTKRRRVAIPLVASGWVLFRNLP